MFHIYVDFENFFRYDVFIELKERVNSINEMIFEIRKSLKIIKESFAKN